MGPLYRAAAGNDLWGRVFFRKRHILLGLPQPMTSGVVYLFRENHKLLLYGASAGNDRWGHLFI
jgi:hypothetical protein